MRARLVVRRQRLLAASSRHPQPFFTTRSFGSQSKFTSTKARPSLPFLLVPRTSSASVRSFTSERRRWLKHEAKLVARYTITLWGVAAAVLTILFAVNEEVVEREFPTPHDWNYLTRKFLRDANGFREPKSGEINWARALELSRGVVTRLEDPKLDGKDVSKLSDKEDPTLEVPGEFNSCDISAKSEEWRRGYFEAIMLAAKAAEHVDGWVRDRTRNVVSPPEFVIGPSNPRPKPIAPGNPHAPREEDCDVAYPSADNFYMKILATKGLTARQKMNAALEYASFMEFKGRSDGPEALYNLALAEATQGIEPAGLPYNPKTFVVKDHTKPSLNILDALSAMATHKARKGDVSSALPIYVSLLKCRRSLSDTPPRPTPAKPRRQTLLQQVVGFFSPPNYPSPPPDGTQPPWRSPYERCQEASLNLYIGEILYATASRDDGLAWTRDSVDLSEEQLRALGSGTDRRDRDARQTCRECLATGLDNWFTMVARLARTEAAKKTSGATSSVFSFWSGSQDAEGRWAAEEAVVQERKRRTKELMEEVTPPSTGIWSFIKA
ncbi:nuclear pore protein NUP57 [Purpureocillium lavendulum]|uniref:Nuclear pore protein NUP57 n=1 Tax=Purpureocillium lavendulum TaxID=1247861 RepID=A0AB34G820_9HYPO|nr:nuclear pore protein NUP57 [Purpureocillium lavendulum]